MIDPARSFDRAAEAYEAARPDYPDALLELLPLPSEATVLDLGAGTGKLTRMLARRYAHVFAVEPLDGMRAILARVVPDAEALAGSAERIPLPDASVDGVFAAQAFHWFATDEAVAEIDRVLRPGGIFADVWNETLEPTPLPAAYEERTKALFAETPVVGTHDERRIEVVRRRFGELHEGSVLHEQVQTRDSTLAFIRSVSAVARRPEPEREALMAELGALLPEGEYRFRIRANVRWAVKS
jgi:ubiquinone/menaquinone biosynthesis C-methylase UbiE